MPKRTFLQARQWLTAATLCAVLATGLAVPPPLHAQEAPAPTTPIVVQTQGTSTVIRLRLPAQDVSSAADAAAASHLPITRFGGYDLPMQFVTLALPLGAVPTLDVQQLEATALAVPPSPGPRVLPPVLDWEPDPAVTDAPPSLPAAPAFVLRSGMVRGRHLAVIAISPIYEQDGIIKIAVNLRVAVAGTTPAAGDLLEAAAAPSTGATGAAVETVSVPVNTAALGGGYRITVSQPGIQEVLYSQLGLAGMPGSVRLMVNNQEVAVETAADRLRFYVPAVGDRWNGTSAYWLTFDAGSKRIGASTAVAPPGPSKGAFEEGKWQENRLYEAGYRGADGDHWFHAKLSADVSLPLNTDVTQSVPVTVTAQTVLPLRSGIGTFYVAASDVTDNTNCSQPFQYHVQGRQGAGLLDTQVVSWIPAPGCNKQTTGTATYSTSQPIDNILLRLKPNGIMKTAVLLESVAWRQPVELNFQAVAGGAEFVTDAGAGSYALRNLPASWQLYDVTLPDAPVIVGAGSGGNYTLNQPATALAGRYYLANLLAVRQPLVQAHAPAQFGDVRGADAIYIGPPQFADELAPLLSLRQQQGFKPLFVNVQSVYDVYGFGQVSAVAIRNFLRDQSDWQNTGRQIAVVLAGDATLDPFAYGGIANEQLVAPWMDEVDPFAKGVGSDYGEAACDACMAQLNGENPLTGDNLDANRQWFAADVWIGRFPVRNEQEAADMVAKLVAYDTAPEGETWRARSVFLADNYIKKLDEQQNAVLDDAGDFANLSDNIVQMLPADAAVQRIYFDPAPDREVQVRCELLNPADPNTSYCSRVSAPGKPGYYLTQPRRIAESWRISDVVVGTGATMVKLPINSLVMGAMNGGAGLVAYNGHSNHWQYAITDDRDGAPDPKWLLNINDVRLLANQNKPYVMLAMTCYTSQFVKPARNGTLDEVLVRAQNAGAVAVWGPTGLSEVNGHDMLQKGFMGQHLKQPGGGQRLGTLIAAGYNELLLGNGTLDPLMTFVLLGDPLTRARFGGAELYMPNIRR